MGRKEKKWECRGTFGVGRVFEDRTRESFHLWSINAERFQHHKSDVFARQDTSSPLPWILCLMSHTSEGTRVLFQATGRCTLAALFEKPRKLLPKRLRRAEQQQRVEKDSKQRTSRHDWGIQKKPHQQPLYTRFFVFGQSNETFLSHYRTANLT